MTNFAAGAGIQCIPTVSEGQDHEVCPFCAQDLSSSPLIDHYRAYFSEGYTSLRRDIVAQSSAISAVHGGDIPAAFERNFRIMEQRRTFWAAFASIPESRLDTAAIARAWKAARDAVAAALGAKQAAPLDRMSLPQATTDAIAAYDAARAEVEAASTAMIGVNEKIAVIKEQAAVANIPALTADLAKLQGIEARFDPAIDSFCQTYVAEKVAKTQTEGKRQVIVLSHSKPFLCELWNGADRLDRAAIRITRDGGGSGLAAWDIRQDSITEHDKRYEKVVAYINASDRAQERAVAAALRPILESFVRVAYPAEFPPGSLLGPFIGICQQRLGMPNTNGIRE